MPTKPNRAGNQQNYVPQGNGDASGEYADNNSGSNKHFTNFAKPNDSSQEEVKVKKRVKKQELDSEKAEEEKPSASKYQTTTKKARFLWNQYWNEWQYMSQKDYDDYLRRKANAEKWGSTAYQNDKIKEIDLKTFNEEDADKVISDSVKLFEKKIDSMDIYQLNKSSNDTIYKDVIAELLGNDFSKEEVNAFIKDNLEKLKQNSSYLGDLVDQRRIKVAQEYIDNNFSKIEGEHSIEDDLKACNPEYSSGYSYTINCQRCPYVYELRRRGYDVQAYPNDDDYGRKKGTNWLKQMTATESYEFNNSGGAKKLFSKISEKVLAAGNGSRWALRVQWYGSRTGHLCIVENVNGEVRFMDSQTGDTNCLRYLNNVAVSKTTSLKRMDNAKFDIGVIMTGFSKKKG